jgi:hypothetical protein
MACQEKVPPEDRGSFDAWEDLGRWSVSEVEAFFGP